MAAIWFFVTMLAGALVAFFAGRAGASLRVSRRLT
jgi:hypothetical protein